MLSDAVFQKKRELRKGQRDGGRKEEGGAQQLILTALLRNGRHGARCTAVPRDSRRRLLVEKPFATVTVNVRV